MSALLKWERSGRVGRLVNAQNVSQPNEEDELFIDLVDPDNEAAEKSSRVATTSGGGLKRYKYVIDFPDSPRLTFIEANSGGAHGRLVKGFAVRVMPAPDCQPLFRAKNGLILLADGAQVVVEKETDGDEMALEKERRYRHHFRTLKTDAPKFQPLGATSSAARTTTSHPFMKASDVFNSAVLKQQQIDESEYRVVDAKPVTTQPPPLADTPAPTPSAAALEGNRIAQIGSQSEPKTGVGAFRRGGRQAQGIRREQQQQPTYAFKSERTIALEQAAAAAASEESEPECGKALTLASFIEAAQPPRGRAFDSQFGGGSEEPSGRGGRRRGGRGGGRGGSGRGGGGSSRGGGGSGRGGGGSGHGGGGSSRGGGGSGRGGGQHTGEGHRESSPRGRGGGRRGRGGRGRGF